MDHRKKLFKYVNEKYGTTPEYLWARFPDYAVLRHSDNRKWYAIIMDVSADKLGLDGQKADILNVKLDDELLTDMLTQREGFFPAYHSRQRSWISVLLDGTVQFNEICELIDISYNVTASKAVRQRVREPKDWIIPANPKYFDIMHAFDETDMIHWKQCKGIKTGDTVYLYVGAPVSALIYGCRVERTDIPYDYSGEINISYLMEIRLLKRYPDDRFTFDALKTEYGIFAVRGPRGIPSSLSEALKKEQ